VAVAGGNGLLAVDPDRVGIEDGERSRGEVGSHIWADGVESRRETDVGNAVTSEEGRTRGFKGRLCRGVILLVEDKCDFVANISVDVRWVVDEFSTGTNINVVVGVSEGGWESDGEESNGGLDHHHYGGNRVVRRERG